MPRMTRFGAVSGLVTRTVVALALVSVVVGCSKDPSTSSAPPSAAPPSTNSTPAPSPERKVASRSVDEKTVVSRLDSAPAVAPVPPSPNRPGATPSPGELELQKEADEAPEWPPPSLKLGKNPSVKNFEVFWKPFRAAMLASDMDALAGMTQFPVQAFSETGSEPEQSIERANFPRLMRRMMAQNTGLDVGGHESHLEFAKRLHRIAPSLVQGPTARVGDLQFVFLDGDGWRFQSAYVSALDESQ